MITTELRHVRGNADVETLQTAIAEILDEVADEPGAPRYITVREISQGADLVATTIIITLVGRAATKFFDEVIWPRLKDLVADDAIGPRESEEHTESKDQDE
jgi:hypothetical protein